MEENYEDCMEEFDTSSESEDSPDIDEHEFIARKKKIDNSELKDSELVPEYNSSKNVTGSKKKITIKFSSTSLDEVKKQQEGTELPTKYVKEPEKTPENADVPEKTSKSDSSIEVKNPESTPKEDLPEEDSEDEETGPKTSNYDPANVRYEGDLAIYTDPSSGYQYQWCEEKNEWESRNSSSYGFEDDTHTYTDAEGIKYFWDKEKNAWFPKIDDDFMAQYQMSYGFVDNTTPAKPVEEVTKEVVKPVEKSKEIKRKAPAPEPTWFEINEQQNTKVYVSNLPTDITEEEFVDFMQKCGLVMRDMATGKMKVKLYAVPGTDILKGDALCTYIKIESVELALKVLDGYLYKGKRVQVERAKFEMKGEYNPSLKPKKKKKKDKDKLKRMQEKLFDWRPDKLRGERAKHERVIIVKNIFEPSIFDKDVGLILEYQQDLREECSKSGDVRRVVLYDRHPEGVAQITMREPEEADACVSLLNGRWFGQRKLTAEIWDGKTKYKIAETDAQITKRVSEWDKFLESADTEDKSGKNEVSNDKDKAVKEKE